MGVSAPLPHQGRAGLQHDAGIEGTSALLELSGQSLQAALQGAARAAMGALLQLIGEGSDEQIATEPQRRSGAMQLPPGKPQLLCRPIDQSGDFAIDLGQVRLSRSVVPVAASTENGATARQSAGEPKHRGLRGFIALAGSAMR